MRVSTIGLDAGKGVFPVHGVDAAGTVVVCKRLRRGEVVRFFGGPAPCLVGMEACASAHHWSRELLVRQRTMLVNGLRAHLAEFGIVARRGRGGVEQLVALLAADAGGLPAPARDALAALVRQLRATEAEIKALDRRIAAWHRATPASRRLATIPGIGPITASALVATLGDGARFDSGRHLAAWLGVVPRQSSTGGKPRLGRISKQGDRYLRRLLVIGATALLRHARSRKAIGAGWVDRVLARRPPRVAITALANKLARLAWAVLARGEPFRPGAVAGTR